jgi:predicted dehydrogenase
VDPENVERAIALILQEVALFVAEPVTDEELADSQANYIGRLPLQLESNNGVANALLNLERYGLEPDYYRRYASLVQAVNPAQALEAARRYLDPNRPMSWRLRQSESGGGVFADLGSHLVDLAMYILGGVSAVRAQTRTHITERFTAKGAAGRETVDVDDWALCSLELSSGASGVIEVTRVAAGASAQSGFEIYGSRGAVVYHESNPDSVRYYNLHKGEWVSAPGYSPTPSGERPLNQIWPSAKYSQGMMTNAHLACQVDLLLNIVENKLSSNNFASAARVQQVVEAAYLSAGQGGAVYKLA